MVLPSGLFGNYMKRLISFILTTACLFSFGQQTPQQIETASAGFKTFSSRDLAMANTYLLSVLVGMGASSPASLLASASAWKAFSDRDLQNVQTYLLSQFAGTVVANSQSTNFGVISTNGNNILISPTNTLSIFTNAGGAIAIGAYFPIGGVTGNGIWIGGGGAGQGGSVGTNAIAIGAGAGAFSADPNGIDDATGAISIGNQADCFGSGSTVICAAGGSVNINPGARNTVFIGNFNVDNSSSPTNVFFFGHRAGNVTLANNTFYFGNGPAGGTNYGRTRNFVFLNGGAYSDDGAIIGNGNGLTNIPPQLIPSNTIASLNLGTRFANLGNGGVKMWNSNGVHGYAIGTNVLAGSAFTNQIW